MSTIAGHIRAQVRMWEGAIAMVGQCHHYQTDERNCANEPQRH